MENFIKVDRKAPKILNALENAPIYRKFGLIKAHPAVVGEKVETVLASGVKETENIAKENDWVMTNPDGESYIISKEKFFSRYEKTDEEGMFSAKGFCKAVKNPFGKPVEIMASWGTPQTGDEECMFADVCDENGTLSREPYIIEHAAFSKTYKLYKE